MPTDTPNTGRGVIERFESRRLSLWLVLAGVVLVLVPEPITSVVGIVVVLAGIVAGIVGRL